MRARDLKAISICGAKAKLNIPAGAYDDHEARRRADAPAKSFIDYVPRAALTPLPDIDITKDDKGVAYFGLPGGMRALVDQEAHADTSPAAVPTTPAEDVPAEDVPTEDVPTEDVPTEDVPTEDVPTEDVPTEDKIVKPANKTARVAANTIDDDDDSDVEFVAARDGVVKPKKKRARGAAEKIDSDVLKSSSSRKPAGAAASATVIVLDLDSDSDLEDKDSSAAASKIIPKSVMPRKIPLAATAQSFHDGAATAKQSEETKAFRKTLPQPKKKKEPYHGSSALLEKFVGKRK